MAEFDLINRIVELLQQIILAYSQLPKQYDRKPMYPLSMKHGQISANRHAPPEVTARIRQFNLYVQELESATEVSASEILLDKLMSCAAELSVRFDYHFPSHVPGEFEREYLNLTWDRQNGLQATCDELIYDPKIFTKVKQVNLYRAWISQVSPSAATVATRPERMQWHRSQTDCNNQQAR